MLEILLVEDNANDVPLTLHVLKKSNLSNRIHMVYDEAEALECILGTGAYTERGFEPAPKASEFADKDRTLAEEGMSDYAKGVSDRRYTMTVGRGEVCLADLNPTWSAEQAGVRAVFDRSGHPTYDEFTSGISSDVRKFHKARPAL